MINSDRSFHICEMEKFTKLSMCYGDLITLLNNDRVKVEGM